MHTGGILLTFAGVCIGASVIIALLLSLLATVRFRSRCGRALRPSPRGEGNDAGATLAYGLLLRGAHKEGLMATVTRSMHDLTGLQPRQIRQRIRAGSGAVQRLAWHRAIRRPTWQWCRVPWPMIFYSSASGTPNPVHCLKCSTLAIPNRENSRQAPTFVRTFHVIVCTEMVYSSRRSTISSPLARRSRRFPPRV